MMIRGSGERKREEVERFYINHSRSPPRLEPLSFPVRRAIRDMICANSPYAGGIGGFAPVPPVCYLLPL